MFPPVDVLGVPVVRLAWPDLRDDVMRRLDQAIATTVMYANVHVVNTAQGDARLAAALDGADLVYCDGEGVRLGARILGDRLPPRMTGADFIEDLFAHLARRRARVAWIGGAPGVAARALELLAARHPGAEVAYARDGYFDKQSQNREVLEALAAARADIVFVGMGTPIQETWVAKHRSAMKAPIVWCIGATADFLTGVQKRGPSALTHHRFEWLARLASDPRRLFARYVIGNPLFVARTVRARLRGH